MNLNDCSLREIDYKDLELLLKWRNSKNIRENMFSNHIITADEHQQWFNSLQKSTTRKSLLFLYLQEPIGVINFTDISHTNNECKWGFYIGKENSPKGAGTMMGYLGMNEVFDKMNMRKITGYVLSFNEASKRYHQRLGFTFKGMMDRKIYREDKDYDYDVLIYTLCKESWGIKKKEIKNYIGG